MIGSEPLYCKIFQLTPRGFKSLLDIPSLILSSLPLTAVYNISISKKTFPNLKKCPSHSQSARVISKVYFVLLQTQQLFLY